MFGFPTFAFEFQVHNDTQVKKPFHEKKVFIRLKTYAFADTEDFVAPLALFLFQRSFDIFAFKKGLKFYMIVQKEKVCRCTYLYMSWLKLLERSFYKFVYQMWLKHSVDCYVV